MALETVRFLPMADACALTAARDTAMISITNPGVTASLQVGWAQVLRVAFSDAEYDEADFADYRARGVRFVPSEKGFPTQYQAQLIRDFCAHIARDAAVHHLVVHCHAGKRRSAAVAMYAAERLGARLLGKPEDPNRTVLALLKDPAWCAVSPTSARKSLSGTLLRLLRIQS